MGASAVWKGKTDWQALIAYLRSLPRWSYRLRDSARLHNKQLFGKKNQKTLPVNMKILIHFHSEFILNQDGQFALILEERPHVNGVVNGASFNYARANNKRHRQLDMAPVGRQDPVFRKELLRSKMESIYRLLAFVATKKEEMRLAGSSLTLISKEAFPMVDIVGQLVWRI